MVNKIWQFFFFLVCINTSFAVNVEVGRYVHWDHPVVPILKRYNISLYKVEYAQHGKIPIFYARFAWDPRVGSSFDEVFCKVLEANAHYPYLFIIKDQNLSIIAEWHEKPNRTCKIDMHNVADGLKWAREKVI